MFSKTLFRIVLVLMAACLIMGGSAGALSQYNLNHKGKNDKMIQSIGTAYIAYRFTDDSVNTQSSCLAVVEALKPTSDFTVTGIRTELATDSNGLNKMTISLKKSDELEIDINIESREKVYKLECGNNNVIFFNFQNESYSMIA